MPVTPATHRRAAPFLSVAAALLAASLPAGSLPAQSLEVVPDTTRVTVGDPLTLRVVPRLAAGASLLSRAAAPAGDLPEGFRILASDSLAATAAGAVEGRLRVAFFRPGKQSVPPLVLAYSPRPGAPPDTLRSQPVPIEVVAVLPPGDQTLRDIKDLAPLPRRSRLWLWLVLAAAVLAAGLLLTRRLRRRPAPAPVAVEAIAPAADSRTPYERALERLVAIERARLPEQGDVPRHFELVTDTLRRYLEESGAAPALELTTTELAWALPPVLASRGLRDAALAILRDADLVKFARVRPSGEAAARLLRAARSLLDDWHAAALSTLALAAAEATAGRPDPAGGPAAGDGGPAGGSTGRQAGAPEATQFPPPPAARPEFAPPESAGVPTGPPGDA